MVIFLISGPVSSGKKELADFLCKKLGFNAIEIDTSYLDPNMNLEIADITSIKTKLLKKSEEIADTIYEKWNENHVVYPILIPEQLDSLKKRQYVILIEIQAPIMKRYKFYCQAKCIKNGSALVSSYSLEKFIEYDDFLKYELGLSKVVQHANLIIRNDSTIDNLSHPISSLPLIRNTDYRPDWDLYFIKIAHIVKLRTNCMKDAVGAVIVSNQRIVSAGYKGTPIGIANCLSGGCKKCNTPVSEHKKMEECICIHAEENAVLECGIHRTKGGTIYVTSFPCLWCTKIILQAGLRKVVYDGDYIEKSSLELFKETNVNIVKAKDTIQLLNM